MSIRYFEEEKKFVLSTDSTEYVLQMMKDRFPVHRYYGKKGGEVPEWKGRVVSNSPYYEGAKEYSPDVLSMEISFFGSGDFRATALRLCGEDGTGVTEFAYRSFRIFPGRKTPEGLPCARAGEDTETLELCFEDEVTGCRLLLLYTVFERDNVISRSMTLQNHGKAPVTIEKCMPLQLDLPGHSYHMLALHGMHNCENNVERFPVHYGIQSVSSRRGSTSHQHNSFFALCGEKTTETEGEAFGFHFVYSGSFLDEIEVDPLGNTRVLVGLGSECFAYTLMPGESFDSPEALMTYSREGLGGMSRNYHRFTRHSILPKESVELPHPVVLNSWEAVYFNIDQELLLKFAEEAKDLGMDMLVMDDGWFGARNADNAGLGDWFVNKSKFPDGLQAFADGIHRRGVKFGIWIEPEMINPDSDLYRAHPEWCLSVPGREAKRSRNQLVLDMSNPAVFDYLTGCFEETFRGVSIDYFKWDFNRNLSDVCSRYETTAGQKAVPFLYMKGVYRLLGWFRQHFPEAIIETCAGGGGRYDLAMMTFGFQIWTSDMISPYRRLRIQYGALLGYPAATMSCHVGKPAEATEHAFDFRFKVACAGMLGYEFDVRKLPDDCREVLRSHIASYRRFEHVMRRGDYYPLVSPFTHDYSAYYYLSEDRKEILLTVVEQEGCKKGQTKRLRVVDALPDAVYRDEKTGASYTGRELRKGLVLPLTGERETAILLELRAL